MSSVADKQQTLIGGMFALTTGEERGTPPPFMPDDAVLLASARGGLALLIDLLEPARVWLPSYLCAALTQAVNGRRSEAKFYPVDACLIPDGGDWIRDVHKGDLVLLIDYFGFPTDRAVAVRAKAQGAWIVEDACQALLTDGVGDCADFVLYSPRKFVGVPDGGILVSRCDVELADAELEGAPLAWWMDALRAGTLRDEFDRTGGDRRWFDLFQASETAVPSRPYAMSELSRRLLASAFDYEHIAAARRANFQVLASRLAEVALFSELPDGVVPLGFPIRLEKRDRIRRALFADEIFPPVHWPLDGVVPEVFDESHRLSRELLTLPCDQRYAAEEMERMPAIVRRAA